MTISSAEVRARIALRRIIPASPARVFEAWTSPAELMRWWGPAGVRCIGAEIDLSVGGRYRIGNQLPDERLVWIEGEFERVEPPHLLVYTWSTEPGGADERVTVRFDSFANGTEVTVEHAKIPTEALRDQHASGWQGCLDGLERYLSCTDGPAVR